MLMITRTDSLIELAGGDRRHLAIDVAHVSAAMLAVERAPCGRVVQVLALAFDNGGSPLRIEGAAYELTALHQTVSEMMLEGARARPVH